MSKHINSITGTIISIPIPHLDQLAHLPGHPELRLADQWTAPIQFDPLNISPYTGYSKIHPSGHFIFPGDYDGDGIQDILTMLGSNAVNYNCHLYNRKVQPDFGSILISGVFALPVSDWPTADKVHIVDFNGDGKSDIMLIKGLNCEIFTFDGRTARRIHYSTNISPKTTLAISTISMGMAKQIS